ncbi:cytochrome P450 724B1-like [Typha latifolia]|uniref:cytochrome P450 724B1-like n=1 Tax=Typha latifolia TaxID=4733 RepID=UPI003C30CE05
MSLLLHSFILVVLVCLFFFLLFFASFQYIYGHNKNSKLPPGSFAGCPLIGDTLSFISPHISSSKGRFLDINIKRYGKIFRAHLFGYPTVVSCDAEFNSFILQNEDRLFVAGYPKNIPGVLGDLTLLVVTGDTHKHIRGVALNLFAAMRTRSSSFISDIECNALRVMDSWKNREKLVFCAEIRKFTFSVIVKQILSLMPEDSESTQILQNFNTFMRGLVSVPINLPGTPYAKAIQANYRIKEIVRKIIRRREKEDGKVEERMDFLAILLHQNELSEEEILSLVLDLLLGGYETTAMLIAIIVKFLGSDHKMLAELREEHLSVKQNKVGKESLSLEDYKKMEFTQCLINEALRLGNVVKFVHRKAIKPIQYKGYEIPVGWKVLPVFSGVHLDPSLHPDPFHFNPWRWEKYDLNGNMRGFMPFGGGKRMCPGSELARLETSLFLHHLVLKFSWTPLMDEDLPMSFPYLDFKNGLQIAIQPLLQLRP